MVLTYLWDSTKFPTYVLLRFYLCPNDVLPMTRPPYVLPTHGGPGAVKIQRQLALWLNLKEETLTRMRFPKL